MIKLEAVARRHRPAAAAIEGAALDWFDLICGGEPSTPEEARDDSADRLRAELDRWLREYEEGHRARSMPTDLADEAALATLLTDTMFEALRTTLRGPDPETMSRALLLMTRELRRRFEATDPDPVERFDELARAAVSRWCVGGDQALPVAH